MKTTHVAIFDMVNFRWQMLHKQIAVTKELFSQRSPGSASMVRMSIFFV
jgi:hypothetical protein